MQIFTLGPWGGPSWSNAKAIWSWRLKICQNRVSGMYFSTRTTRPPDPPLGGKPGSRVHQISAPVKTGQKGGQKGGPVSGPEIWMLTPRFFCSFYSPPKGCLLCRILAPRFHPKYLNFQVCAQPRWKWPVRPVYPLYSKSLYNWSIHLRLRWACAARLRSPLWEARKFGC